MCCIIFATPFELENFVWGLFSFFPGVFLTEEYSYLKPQAYRCLQLSAQLSDPDSLQVRHNARFLEDSSRGLPARRSHAGNTCKASMKSKSKASGTPSRSFSHVLVLPRLSHASSDMKSLHAIKIPSHWDSSSHVLMAAFSKSLDLEQELRNFRVPDPASAK